MPVGCLPGNSGFWELSHWSDKYLYREISVMCHSWQHNGVQPAFRISLQNWMDLFPSLFQRKLTKPMWYCCPVFTTASLEGESILSTNAILKLVCAHAHTCMRIHESATVDGTEDGSPKSKFLCPTVHIPTIHKKTSHQQWVLGIAVTCLSFGKLGLIFWCFFFLCSEAVWAFYWRDAERSSVLCSRSAVRSLLVCKREKLYFKRNNGSIQGGIGPNAAWAYENERQWYWTGM